MKNCIFCKICSHELKSDIVFEDKDVIVFKDINPKAATHLLVVPKKHVESLAAVGKEEWPVVLKVLRIAAKVAKDKKIRGYKTVFNVGREGGQMVDHIHLHLLSGREIELP